MVKTVGLAIRENIINQLRQELSQSSVYFFIGFDKVSSSAASQLRNRLRLVDSRIFIAKNSLIRKAFESQGLDNFQDYLEGQTGVIFIYNEDIVGPCKVLVEFASENESLLIKGGVIDRKKITREDLESLAKLPSREILLGQAVSGLAAPLTGFLACLNQILLKFVWAVNEIKKVKESQKQEVEGKEVEKQEVEGKEVEKQEVEKQEVEKQGEEAKEKENKEAEKPEEKLKEEPEKKDKENKEKSKEG